MFFRATRKLSQLDDRLQTVERTIKRMELEWEETYDRLRVTMSRIVRRAKALEKAEPPLEPSVDEMALPESAPAEGLLSPHQQLINRQILSRRNRAKVTQ